MRTFQELDPTYDPFLAEELQANMAETMATVRAERALEATRRQALLARLATQRAMTAAFPDGQYSGSPELQGYFTD